MNDFTLDINLSVKFSLLVPFMNGGGATRLIKPSSLLPLFNYKKGSN